MLKTSSHQELKRQSRKQVREGREGKNPPLMQLLIPCHEVLSTNYLAREWKN